MDLDAPLQEQAGKGFLTPNCTLGRVSYAPATQTTVVTTTTTTTTSFPPFTMKAPNRMRERDPELYPLAGSPTPQSIRKFKFDAGDSVATFEEAEDAGQGYQQFQQEQMLLRENRGVVRSISSHKSHHSKAGTFKEAGALDRSIKRSRSRLSNITPNSLATPLCSSGLVPPSQEIIQSSCRQQPPPLARTHPLSRGHSFDSDSESQTFAATPQSSDGDSDERNFDRISRPFELHYESANCSKSPDFGKGSTRHAYGSTTPPVAQSDANPFEEEEEVIDEPPRRVNIPPVLDTSPIQDASLPSPSLSPITAGARLNHPGRLRGARAISGTERQLPPLTGGLGISETTGFSHTDLGPSRSATASLESNTPPSELSQDFFANIPNMLDTFDSMPDTMKTYVMYQLLRRCSKPTLHFVSDVVAPALKCDFLTRLPLELALNTLKYLDAKTMCRAAQVSRRWRQIVDSDETHWKELIESDKFQLAEGEVERAIREGWGWQAPSGTNARERDISDKSQVSVDQSPTHPLEQTEQAFSPDTNKRKRKALRQVSGSKKQKRKEVLTRSDAPSAPWMTSMHEAQGPNAFANAAAMAVVNPPVGLSSLRNLHLFKSIYRRHYEIRKSWMSSETRPQHLAFRAHQRNVVTCLQFDDEKVLTGSDDANIDIYDTKTGASLRRLEGHEGGVWALEYHKDILVSGSTDRSVRIWNMKDGRCLQVFQGHTSTVRCLQIVHPVKVGEMADGTPVMMPRQPLIITGSRDSTCRVWKLPKIGDRSIFQTGPPANDYDNPYFVRALTGHVHSVRAIAAYADRLVSGSYDSTVRVWKISTGELIHRLQGHSTKVYSVVLDHERGRCISGSMDNFVKVWNLETGQCMFNLEGHTSLVGLLDLRDDYLVSAAADSTLRIWNPENGWCKHILKAHTGAITCFFHDGQKVISGSDGSLKMWNTKTGEWVRDLLNDLTGVWQIKFDERRCIAAVQRNNWTYIEVLDFGAAREGVPRSERGRRIVVNSRGEKIPDELDINPEPELVDVGTHAQP